MQAVRNCAGSARINQKLLDKILRPPRLPSLPTVAIEGIDLVPQQDGHIKQIAHTISQDPALSIKIANLQSAIGNSEIADFRTPHPGRSARL
jgi:HD-like signal output (HDOD) protein